MSIPILIIGTSSAESTPVGSKSVVSPDSEVNASSGSNRFVVWHDDSPGNTNVLFKRSTDGGATWRPTVNLSNSPIFGARDPIIIVSGSNVFVAWTENADIIFRRSTDNGATWKPIFNMSKNDELSIQPRMAVSGSNVYMAWQDHDQNDNEIYLRRSTDNGATWKPLMKLSNNAGDSNVPRIAASGSRVFVVWQDNTLGNWEIMMRRSTDNGATWQAVKNLSSNASDSLIADPETVDDQIAISGSIVGVVWFDGVRDDSDPPGNFDIFFRRSTDNGVSWQAVKNLSNNAGWSAIPKIAMVGSNVYVTWTDDTSGNRETLFRRSTDGGVTWKVTKNLSNNIADSVMPQLAASGGNVFIIWQDDTPGKDDILFRRSTDNGATWKPVKNLSITEPFSTFADFIVIGSGVYTVWREHNPDDTEIYFKRSTDSGATWGPTRNLSNNAGGSSSSQVGG